MNIRESAKALGELIKEDPVTVAYFAASDAYKQDPKLKNLIFEYNVQQTALQEEKIKVANNRIADLESITGGRIV